MSNKVEELALAKLENELDHKKEFLVQRNKLGIEFPHQLGSQEYSNWLDRFSIEEKDLIRKKISVISSGLFSVLPLTCPGNNTCPHFSACPFRPNTPNGFQCPLEQQLIMDRMHSLMREYQLDGSRASDFMLLNRLVELEVTDFRCTSMLSSPEYQGIMREMVTGSTAQGTLITNEVVSPLLELKEKISREKMKLLNSMVGTPESRYKKQVALKEVKTEEYSNKISKMNKQLMDLEKKLLAAGSQEGDKSD